MDATTHPWAWCSQLISAVREVALSSPLAVFRLLELLAENCFVQRVRLGLGAQLVLTVGERASLPKRTTW